MTRVPAEHEGFNHGWFFWPYTLRAYSPTAAYAIQWTHRIARYQRAMGARTL